MFLLKKFFAQKPALEKTEWLGSYVGGEIPGYEILSSHFALNRKFGGPTSDINPPLFWLEEICRNAQNGKAVVNLRLMYSLGDVSDSVGKGGVVEITSPGAFGAVYGDCVTAVRPKSKR
jgi:hypothetical protein